eukprot:4331068-Alexandrium_andersonii.AAC.1
MSRSWDPVFEGNGDPVTNAARFLYKYDAYLVKQQPFDVPDVCPKKLQQCFRRNPHTAGAPEGWQPSEMAHLPLLACTYLADMLNRIECGGQWPQAVLTASCSWLGKGQGLQ